MSGHQDLGTGSNTALRALAAEPLGISFEEVSILTGDTNLGQYDYWGARASRELVTGGPLILCAIEEIKQKIRGIAAPKLEANPDDLEVYEKKVYVKGVEERAISFAELLTSSVVGSASGPMGSSFPLIEKGVKARQPLVVAIEVEVDIETGEVKPIKIITGNCPGRMVNPAVVKGQYDGGAMMGLGLALYEKFSYDEKNSVYLSCSYTDYKVPRALDTPPIDNVIVEEVVERPPHVGLPYGALAVGELGCWGGAAVVANAIYNAIGVRVKTAPMTAEVIVKAITSCKGDK